MARHKNIFQIAFPLYTWVKHYKYWMLLNCIMITLRDTHQYHMQSPSKLQSENSKRETISLKPTNCFSSAFSTLFTSLWRRDWFVTCDLFSADVKEQVSGTGICVIWLLSPYLRASPMFLSLSPLPSPRSSLWPRQVIMANYFTTDNT